MVRFFFSLLLLTVVVALNAEDTAFLDYIATLSPSSWKGANTEYCSRSNTVTCDASRNNLIALKLNNQGITGMFSYAKTQVRMLTSLQLQSNTLLGFSCSVLPTLLSIDLSSNSLSTLPVVPESVRELKLAQNIFTSVSMSGKKNIILLDLRNNPLLSSITLTSFPILSTLNIETMPAVRLLSLAALSSVKSISISSFKALGSIELVDIPFLSSLNPATITTLTSAKFVNTPQIYGFATLPNFFPSMTNLDIQKMTMASYLLSFGPALKMLTMSGMSILQQLTIIKLSRLEKVAFYDMPSLSSVKINDNPLLSSFVGQKVNAQVMDLSNNALSSYSEGTTANVFSTLNLSNNAFSSLPSNVFASASELLVNSNVKLTTLSYYPSTVNARLQKIEFAGCSALQKIYLRNLANFYYHSPLTDFPTLSTIDFAFTPMLTTFMLSSLPRLDAVNLISFPASNLSIKDTPLLKTLGLYTANISSMNDLTHVPSLVNLHLEKCQKMNAIEINKTFPFLEKINIYSMNLSKVSLTAIPYLKTISISGSSIDQIIYNQLNALSAISMNGLSSLGVLSLVSLNNMVSLNLNSMPSLRSVVVSVAPVLDTIKVTSAGLHSMRDLALTSVPSLKLLDLSYNSLDSLNVANLGSLTALSARYCRSLFSVSLSTLPSLQTIDFAEDTGINTILISGVNSMKEIKLNSFSKLNSFTIDKAPILTYLRIAGSSLFRIDLTQVPSLLTAELLSNKIASPEFLSFGNAVTKLDLTANSFANFSLNNNSVLQELILSGNALSSLKLSNLPSLTRFEFGTNVRELSLDGLDSLNKLTIYGATLYEVELKNMKTLSTLSTQSQSSMYLSATGCSGLYKLKLDNLPNLSTFSISGATKLAHFDVKNVSLKALTVKGTNIGGQLSDFLQPFDVRSFTTLQLDSNRFNGAIPETVLSTFTFTNNYLTGTAPQVYIDKKTIAPIAGNCISYCGGLAANCLRRADCSCTVFPSDVCPVNSDCKVCPDNRCIAFKASC